MLTLLKNLMEFKSINFNHNHQGDFSKELRKRINQYFKENNISKYGNANMVIKTIFMISLYLVPYFLMIFNVFTNPWAVFFLWILMGLGMAGIGFSIMHDANHGSYSKNTTINKYLGYLINLVGGSAINWKIQHNVLHHTYTNIHDHDEDLDTSGLMRFSHHQKRYKFHRLQFIYAWFLYGLLTISWLAKKDFIQLNRYKKMDLIKTQGIPFKAAYWRLVFAKLFYVAYMILLPILFSSQPWWLTLVFFMCMHYVSSLILSTVFQAAHVVGETAFPTPDKEGKMEDNFIVHQLKTTANFSKKNRLLSWYVGGLNFQVEHHLFPNICHVHYRKLSDIVKKTAQEYNIPYHSGKSFTGALISHAKLLYLLGKKDYYPSH